MVGANAGVDERRGMPPGAWSLDAWAMWNPRQAFEYAASTSDSGGVWVVLRRPLLVAVVLGCVASLLVAGTLTARIAPSATVYWAAMPACEVLALVLVTRRRLKHRSVGSVVDRYFAGHGPWTLLLIVIAAVLSSVSQPLGWTLLTGPILSAMVPVMAWSAYIDYCFFRHLLGATRSAAARDVIVLRLIVWPAVFVIFAVPSSLGVSLGLTDALRELAGS